MGDLLEDRVAITVDGKEIQTPKGTLLWEACKSVGIDIPIFCYHTKLGPVGACRTCLVEVEGVTKGPITACSTPVTDGMVVHTRSPVAQKAQRGIFEFLLANHPLDCPICDRGGECPLQDQTFAYGPGSSRYIEPKRHHEKPVPLGPTIALDRERCVLCWRCVRFCSEVAEDNSIVLLDRGDHSMVGTFKDEPYVSNFSGNVVELCPVGALTSRKQRFTFRPWELRNRPSVCPHCPMGCNINISVRKNDEVIRFLSRDNPDVDDSWLCDRGRFNFEFINSPHRLTSPLIRRDDVFVESSWSEALAFIADRLKTVVDKSGPGSVAGIASPRLTNEDLFVFKRFVNTVIGSSRLDHYPRPQVALTSTEQSALERLDRRLVPISRLDEVKTILILGADPSLREPVMELRIRKAVNRHGAKLVLIHSDEIALTHRAEQVLRYPEGRIADVAAALAANVAGSDGAGLSNLLSGEAETVAKQYMSEGPIVVLYDDTFEGVQDKGGALSAVSEFVEALAGTVEVGVIPMLDASNSMGARDLAIFPAGLEAGTWGEPVTAQLLRPDAGIRALLLLGANIASGSDGEAWESALKDLDLLVVHELFLTESARLADVVLPVASFAEKIGTLTNTEGRVQALTAAVPTPGIARADWEILVELSGYFDRTLDYSHPRDIWDDIRRSVPKYSQLALDVLGPQGQFVSALQPA